MPDLRPVPNRPTNDQRARLALDIGDQSRLSVDVAVTPAGLLAIGGLVSMILLSTAVIVAVARHR